MSPYDFLNINLLSGILLVVYSLALIFLLATYMAKLDLLTKGTLLTLCSGFLFLVFVTVFTIVFRLREPPLDTIDFGTIIRDPSTFRNYSLGVQTHTIFNSVVFALCFRQPVLFLPFSVGYYFWGIILIWRAFERYFSNLSRLLFLRKTTFLVFLILCILYPMAFLTIPTLLRESLMILALGAAMNIYSKNRVYGKLSAGDMFVYFIAFIVLLGVRPIVAISFLLGVFLESQITKKNRSIGKTFTMFLSLTIIIIFINILAKFLYNISFSVEWISAYRDSYVIRHGDEGYGFHMNWSGPLNVFINILLLFIQYVISPIPILFPSGVGLRKGIALLDTSFVLLLIAGIVVMKHKPTFFKNWGILIVVFLFLPSIFETHVTGAFRHRMNAIILLIPMGSYFITNLFVKLKSK